MHSLNRSSPRAGAEEGAQPRLMEKAKPFPGCLIFILSNSVSDILGREVGHSHEVPRARLSKIPSPAGESDPDTPAHFVLFSS